MGRFGGAELEAAIHALDSPAMYNTARIALGKEPITFARAPR